MKAFANKQNNVIMTNTTFVKIFILQAFILLSVNATAQELYDYGEQPVKDSLSSTTLRPNMSILIGAGSAFVNPDYENFLELQLKSFITSQIVVSGNFKKFDVGNYDFKDQGFLSGDLNAEWFISPEKKITPFIYAGPGILISNDFDDKNYKVQGGVGLDVLINDWISIMGALEANYIYDEQKGSQLLQEVDGLYYNLTIGVQFYFGNRNTSSSRNTKKKKEKIEDQTSTIQTNWIDDIK